MLAIRMIKTILNGQTIYNCIIKSHFLYPASVSRCEITASNFLANFAPFSRKPNFVHNEAFRNGLLNRAKVRRGFDEDEISIFNMLDSEIALWNNSGRTIKHMKSPQQEIVAQLVFWGGILCGPSALVVLVFAFKAPKLWKTLILFAIGGLLLCIFFWYFSYLGGAIGGNSHFSYKPTPWYYFLVPAYVIPVMVASIKFLLKTRTNRSRNS